MLQLLHLYPHAIITEYNVTIDIFDDNDVIVCFYLSNLCESYAWDKSHTDLTNKLLQSINLVDVNLDIETKLIKILHLFEKKFNKIHGFQNISTEGMLLIDQFKDYDKSEDIFWEVIKTKFNVNCERKLKIVTYGFQFYPQIDKHVLSDCNSIQVTYDVRALRTPKEKQSFDFKILAKLRGTSLKVQQEIRETDMFESVMQNIIKEIEDNNLEYIAICCNRGHHRSVACAELLKYLYVNAKINHLTIN